MDATNVRPVGDEEFKPKSQEPKKKGLTRKSSTVPAQVKPTPDNLIMYALQNGRTMEEIKFLYDMRNQELARIALLDFREAKKNFLKAVPRLYKNREANFGETSRGAQGASYRFSDLDNLINTVKGAEADAGLSHDWKTSYDDKNNLVITCILSHVGGHSETDTLKWPPDKSGGKTDIHAMKSTVSYLRRATLESVLGLSQGGDDNDGKDAPEQNTFVDLPALTDEGYKILVKSVRAGTMTVDQAQKAYHMSPEQVDSLRYLEPPANANP
jgi:hypothetical protein